MIYLALLHFYCAKLFLFEYSLLSLPIAFDALSKYAERCHSRQQSALLQCFALGATMGGLATLLLALATPDMPREWKPIPGLGQPPPTAEDLDTLRRFSTPQEVVDRALIAPRLLPVLEAERVPAVAEMLLLLPAIEINATQLRDSLARKVGLQRARVTVTAVAPYGGRWDWPEIMRLDPRTRAPFVPHATNTTRVAFQIEPAGGRSWEQEHQRDTLLRFERLFTKGLLPHANAPRPLEGDFPYVLLSLHVFAEGERPSPGGKHALPAPRTAMSLLVDSPQAQPAATPSSGTPGGQTAAPLSASEMQPAAEPTEHCPAGFPSECVDGSCHRPSAVARGVCTLGCPAGRLRCADGSCIGNATTRCAPPLVKLQAVSEATVVDVSVLRPLPLEVHADDGSILAHLSLPQWAYGVGRPRLRVVVTRVPHAEALRLLPLANRSASNLLRSPAFRLSVGIAGAEDLPTGLSAGAADAAQMSDLEAPLLPEPAKLRMRCQVGAVSSDEARKRDVEALCLARLQRDGDVTRWRCAPRAARKASRPSPRAPRTRTHLHTAHTRTCTLHIHATCHLQRHTPLSTRPTTPPPTRPLHSRILAGASTVIWPRSHPCYHTPPSRGSAHLCSCTRASTRCPARRRSPRRRRRRRCLQPRCRRRGRRPRSHGRRPRR